MAMTHSTYESAYHGYVFGVTHWTKNSFGEDDCVHAVFTDRADAEEFVAAHPTRVTEWGDEDGFRVDDIPFNPPTQPTEDHGTT